MTLRYRRASLNLLAGAIAAGAFPAPQASAQGARGAAAATPPPRPVVSPPRPYVFPAVTRTTLPNGLQIAVLERHDLPMIVTRAVVLGGSLADPAGKEGAFLTMRMVINDGTPARPAVALAERFAEMGSTVNDSGFVTTTANFDSSLAVLADLLRNPAFLAPDVARARALRLDLVSRARTAGNTITSHVIPSVLYGAEHPFARFESEASLSGLTRDDIAGLHARWVRPPNITIVVVGDVTPAVAVARVTRWFGDWARGTGGSVADLRIPGGPFAAPPTAIYLVDVPSPTAYIRVAGLSAARTSPDLPSLDVMNAIYGELSGSRLFKELREKRKFAYSTRSNFLWRASPAPSVFHATVSSVPYAQADSAIAALMSELRGIAGARPPTADEFEFGKRNRIESLPLQLETQERMTNMLSEIVQQNLPIDFLTRYVAGLRAVTPDRLLAAAARHVDGARTAIVIVGDAKVLEAQLRASNIAPVFVVDDRGKRIR